jgi:hypothetical protein
MVEHEVDADGLGDREIVGDHEFGAIIRMPTPPSIDLSEWTIVLFRIVFRHQLRSDFIEGQQETKGRRVIARHRFDPVDPLVLDELLPRELEFNGAV